MWWCSTRDKDLRVSTREAFLSTLAPDGSLYVPTTFPSISTSDLGVSNFQDLSARLGAKWLSGFLTPEDIRGIVGAVFNFPLPLVKMAPNRYVLELFHGPTGAFKDFGAGFLAGVLSLIQPELKKEVLVITATSGDTGAAVARAFWNKPGVRALILYPKGRITPFQEDQICRYRGNIFPLAIQGDFDDCQSLAKKLLTDPGLADSCFLTAANSVHIGRLIPQTFYYAELRRLIPAEKSVCVAVPSGNLGNLTAGMWSLKMGLKGIRLLGVNNSNRALVNYFQCGSSTKGVSRFTLSSAMDVANPSNLERIIQLLVCSTWNNLKGDWVSEEETKETIALVQKKVGYILDPHTAVGWAGLEKADLSKKEVGLVLATAAPYKFLDALEQVLPPAVIAQIHTPAEMPYLAGFALEPVFDAVLSWVKNHVVGSTWNNLNFF